MQLVYIRMPNRERFENDFEMNFTSRYSITYDKYKRELQINNNNIYENLFVKEQEKSKINDIIAIVGENGVGKSSIINYIKNNIFNKKIEIQDGDIVIFKDRNKFKVFLKESDVEINLDKNEYEIISVSDSIDNLNINSLAVFYSNVFDYPDGNANGDNSIDVTTNSLVVNYTKEVLDKQLDSEKSNIITNNILLYKYMEVENEINFIVNNKDIKIPFEMPDKIIIRQNSKYYEKIDFTKEKRYDKESIHKYEEIFKRLDKYEKIFLNSLVREDLIVINKDDTFIDELYLVYMNNEKTSFIDALRAFKNSNKNIKNILYSNIENTVKLMEISNSLDIYYKWEGIIKLSESREFLKVLMKAYFVAQPFFFEWQLSSGEKAFLSMYSRFYKVSQKEKVKEYKGEYINIFIDECDVYLHPEWQRRYIETLIDMSNSIFAENSFMINIILSTHSPIIISDLTQYNIRLLCKEDNKTIVKNSFNNVNLTFACNINTLYTEKFFMKDGVIGSFAKAKINKLCKDIEKINENTTQEEYKNYEKIIELIGEDIVKERLQYLLLRQKKKFYRDYDKVIKELEGEIERLKRLRSEMK